MADPVEQPKKSLMEKHIQTLLQAVIAALVLWLGNTVNNAQLEIAKLGVQMEQVRTEVASLQGRTEDRYTNTMAQADRQRIYDRIDENSKRIQALERKVH